MYNFREPWILSDHNHKHCKHESTVGFRPVKSLKGYDIIDHILQCTTYSINIQFCNIRDLVLNLGHFPCDTTSILKIVKIAVHSNPGLKPEMQICPTILWVQFATQQARSHCCMPCLQIIVNDVIFKFTINQFPGMLEIWK